MFLTPGFYLGSYSFECQLLDCGSVHAFECTKIVHPFKRGGH